MKLKRRDFIRGTVFTAAGGMLPLHSLLSQEAITQLPEGSAPAPVGLPHFPHPLHAFVWRNWTLVPTERLAKVLGARRDQIVELGKQMGLSSPPTISEEQWRRSYITIIRRNWHLLPYSQLLELLDWTPPHMAYMLREDDFLFIKLGSLKPKCEPLKFFPADEAASKRLREIAATLQKEFPAGKADNGEPLFSFVKELSGPVERKAEPQRNNSPRFCYSYFALYGDPLLEPTADPYPEGYLQRLAAIGVNGVWLQAILTKLAPFPWVKENETERRKRLENLRALAKRAARHGIGIYLYLNEPRSMPLGFFKAHPELKGVTEGEYATLCTSVPEVQEALKSAVAQICREVPDIAGFFTITASENLTNCWSHSGGKQCPRCSKRTPGEVIAEAIGLFQSGIQQTKSKARLIVWDWGWQDSWAPEIIQRLPKEVAHMSVSEWSIPIQRGGVDSVVGEYSISAIGPGPRATRHWKLARERGLKTLAKIQAGNTWELSATPYIPALENVARHVANLREVQVDGLMLGWTLGGYPSPNLEVACEINSSNEKGGSANQIVSRTLERVAVRRFGKKLGPAVVQAWRTCSQAFSEFPYHGGVVYNAPMQFGPSNLLWAEPTGYRSTMIGFPYDDLDGWRQVYPSEIFIQQFTKMAEGFDAAAKSLVEAMAIESSDPSSEREARREIDVIKAAAIHFRSTANQASFVRLRGELPKGSKAGAELKEKIQSVLNSELDLAKQLHEIQERDSRIGFEATNHYYYVPHDLKEKALNCHYLLDQWLPNL